jgi:hypothetical protein
MTNLDMFPATTTDVAKARRDLGIERAGAKADRQDTGWRAHAAKLIGDYAAWARMPFLIEDAAAYAHTHGLPVPTDGRAWGSAAQLAKRLKLVRPCGFRAAKSSNLSPKTLWEGVR